jgi:two-component system response regulator HydG
VAAVVILSGLIISQLVTHRYSVSLLKAAAAQAENIAHALALDAADKIFINDLVALQKLLDDQIISNPAVAYLFIIKDGHVLTHTFPNGVPMELVSANAPADNKNGHLEKIISNKKERYLDIAWPIFSGNAGVLRLGFSEKPYRHLANQLWIQMNLVTLGILMIALMVGLLFIKRITGPLLELSKAVENIDEGHLEANIALKGRDEVARLASSFNKMLARIKDYTQRLEEKTIELDRAYQQTRTSFAIAQEISALSNLKDISAFLIQKLQKIVTCKQMVLLVFSSNMDILFVQSEKNAQELSGESVETAKTLLKGMDELTFIQKDASNAQLAPHVFQSAEQLAVFPLHHENQLQGAMIVACPGDCNCVTKQLEVIGLILNQISVAIRRLVLYEEEIRILQGRLDMTAEYSGIVGKDPKMQTIFKLIEDIAPTDATVLIQGESGTGKELVASAIHQQSTRTDKPFVVINCSAYPATLLESEIFGHERGAFTGAIRQKSGRFEQADGGTVFLDEIGEIPPSAQIKLLRVLQAQKFERVGGEQTLSVDVRILAATNKDLLQEVKKGNFREDLFYRLNVIPIRLPHLKKRQNDIPLLARYFLRRYATEQDRNIKRISPEAMRRLLDYRWPGNVRELENSIEHAVLLAKGDCIEISDLPPALREANLSLPAPSNDTISENEKRLLRDVLNECNWNKKQAARQLGISRSSLYSKLKKYQINKPTLH